MSFVLRRQIMVYLIVFGWQHGIVQITIFAVVCLLVLASKIYIRPYKCAMIGAQEIIFEIILNVVIILFITFSTEKSEMVSSGSFHIIGIACFALVISLMVINYIFTTVLLVKN